MKYEISNNAVITLGNTITNAIDVIDRELPKMQSEYLKSLIRDDRQNLNSVLAEIAGVTINQYGQLVKEEKA